MKKKISLLYGYTLIGTHLQPEIAQSGLASVRCPRTLFYLDFC